MIEIRPMRAEDLPFVAETERELFSDAWSERALADELTGPFAKSYILRENGVPCAYGLFRLLAGEGEVLRIGTLPAHRRKGFARAVLEYFLTKNDVEKVFLEVRAGNAPARGLYESLGFRSISIRTNYYRDPIEDAVIYEKK